jgi:amino acid transporter
MAAYNGFQTLGPLGGEVANPQRNIPRAAILGSLLVVFLYVAINWIYFYVLGFSGVAQSQYVAPATLAKVIGDTGAKWMTIAMIVSAFGSLHANFLTGPRVHMPWRVMAISLPLPGGFSLSSIRLAVRSSFRELSRCYWF